MAGTKRNLGLKDIYVAVVTKNTKTEYVCEEPQFLCRGIKAKIKIKKSTEKLYSSSELEDSISQFDSAEVELEGDWITAEMEAILKGATLTKGVLTFGADDEGKEVALMYRNKRKNNKYDFQCFYCGKFDEESEDEYETTEDKTKTSTKKLKGTFYSRQVDGKYMSKVYEDELVDATDTDAKTIIQEWFSKVPNQVPTIGE